MNSSHFFGFSSKKPSVREGSCRFTLFAVAVAPVDASPSVSEEAPWPDPAVRVPAVVVFSKPLTGIARLHAGHLAPVHAPRSGLGHVDGAPVAAGPASALSAFREREDGGGRRRSTTPAAAPGGQEQQARGEGQTRHPAGRGDLGGVQLYRPHAQSLPLSLSLPGYPDQ